MIASQSVSLSRPRLLVGIEQAWTLTVRSILATARKTDRWAPGLIFPLAMAAVYSSQFAKATAQPGQLRWTVSVGEVLNKFT